MLLSAGFERRQAKYLNGQWHVSKFNEFVRIKNFISKLVSVK